MNDAALAIYLKMKKHEKFVKFLESKKFSKAIRKLIDLEKAAIKECKLKLILLGVDDNFIRTHENSDFYSETTDFILLRAASASPIKYRINNLNNLDFVEIESRILSSASLGIYDDSKYRKQSQIRIESIKATTEKINKQPVKLFQNQIPLRKT